MKYICKVMVRSKGLLLCLMVIAAIGYGQGRTTDRPDAGMAVKGNVKSINNYYKSENVKADYVKSSTMKAKNNDFAGARADLEKALTLNPKDANAHLSYALLMLNNFNDLPKAKSHFELAVNIEPNFAKAHYFYAVALKIFYNDNVNARLHYLTASKIKPTYISKNADKLFGIKR